VHSQGRNEEFLALSMQAVRNPGGCEVRSFVTSREKQAVNEPVAKNAALRVDAL
jgi:hypothetical protein